MVYNIESLSNDELLFAYKDVILYYEKLVKDKKGFYINSKEFQSFIKDKNILIKNTTAEEIKIAFNTKKLTESYFLFTTSNYSQVRDLYRHLRNSFAHGLFTKTEIKKTVFLCFDDIYNKKYTMRGQIQKELFVEFIEKLQQTKK